MRAEERLGRHPALAARTRLHGASVLALPTVPAPEKSSISITIRRDGIARITLDRPPLNVLDAEMLRRLNDALRECDAPSVRVVVIASALPRAFSAGVEVRDHLAGRLDAMLSEVRENARLLLTMKPVTIAAVHGSTLGGGAEIALLCDLVLAGDDTVLGFPEIKLGAFPPVAAACLPEICGGRRSMRLLLGESITASDAERTGLVTQVVPAAALAETVERVAGELAARSGVALHALTAATRGQRAPALLQRLDAAIATYRATVGPSHDAVEGISAFLEKRTPAWSHR
jgi:cyclohexa-1,5-dienecarbonyl-CoA hydratase